MEQSSNRGSADGKTHLVMPEKSKSTLVTSTAPSSSQVPGVSKMASVPSPGKKLKGSPSKNRLQAAVVIDLQSPVGLRSREHAWKEIQKLTKICNMDIVLISFEKLDFGETSSLDSFYDADVVIADMTVAVHRNTLFYHLGVRLSMQQMYNIITYNAKELVISQSLNPVKAVADSYRVLMYSEREEEGGGVVLGAWEPTKMFPNDIPATTTTAVCPVGAVPFATKLQRLLNEVEIDASVHGKDKFLNDLRYARANLDEEKLAEFLDKMRLRMDDPGVISVDTVINMLLSYRDIQHYDAMVKLVEDLKRVEESVSNLSITETAGIMFNYAFALNRRNEDGDRAKAIKVVDRALANSQTSAPDLLCLAGRIYKDMFVDSEYLDVASRDEAIKWYRKAFDASPNEYSGINLATLMVVAGDNFQESAELQRVAIVLNSLLGRKGSLQNLKDYWDVATFFEISVLAKDYAKACQAALKMFLLKPPTCKHFSALESQRQQHQSTLEEAARKRKN